MTAPALVLLSLGSPNHRITEVTHRLRVGLQSRRPELEVNAAFLEHCPPNLTQVATRLAARGVQEIVLVPLQLGSALQPLPAITHLAEAVTAAQPPLQIAVAQPLGPDARFLSVLDRRLRQALRQAQVDELDGLILSCAGQPDLRGASVMTRLGRQWSAHHRLDCAVALSTQPGDGIGPAIARLHSRGRRRLAVGSFHLTGNRYFTAQAREALRCGALVVSEPIGVDEAVYDAVLTRYAFAAMGLVDLTKPANSSAQTAVATSSVEATG